VLVGSDLIWDRRRRTTMTQSQLKLAHHEDFKDWVTSEDLLKLDAEKLVFKPQGAEPGELNIYDGLPHRPDPSKACGRITEHLAFLCGGDGDLTHWVTCWLAYPLQHPGAKMRTALVFYGDPGTGKSILFEEVMAHGIYGLPYATIIRQDQIESRFTGWASGKLFVVADEIAANPRDSRTRNFFKGLITGKHVAIEKKGQDARTEENHLNMVILSNEGMPVQVETGDRRYAVSEVNHVHGRDYFQALGAEIAAGGAAGFHAYLLDYDLDGFNEFTLPPATKAKAELAHLGAHSSERFIAAWLAEELPLPAVAASTDDLYRAYDTWCKLNGERLATQSSAHFGKLIGKRLVAHRGKISGETVRWWAAPGENPDASDVKAFELALKDWIAKAESRVLR
jgi:putative DNA primase/helicase